VLAEIWFLIDNKGLQTPALFLFSRWGALLSLSQKIFSSVLGRLKSKRNVAQIGL